MDARDTVLVTTLREVTKGNSNSINYTTVLLPPFVGGLTKEGMLDGTKVAKTTESNEEMDEIVKTLDEEGSLHYDVADEWYADKHRTIRRRTRVWGIGQFPEGMILEREVKIQSPDNEDDEESVRIWRWFLKKPEVVNEHSRRAYELRPHLEEVKHCASQIVERLGLPDDIAEAIIFAAWCHDLGKERERWQRGSLGNDSYPDRIYAKSGWLPDGTTLRPRELFKKYRHEFGSVLDLLEERHPRHTDFMTLSSDMRELALHLIAAHHGRARPHFPMDEVLDPERNGRATTALAVETPRRFARLQRKYGRWGLAYLESLVRAADYTASASPGQFLDSMPTME